MHCREQRTTEYTGHRNLVERMHKDIMFGLNTLPQTFVREWTISSPLTLGKEGAGRSVFFFSKKSLLLRGLNPSGSL